MRLAFGGFAAALSVTRRRVPVDLRVRVLADGEGDDDGYVVDGQPVEVVGVGARRAGAYRAGPHEFVFDAERPLEVWVGG